MQKGIKGIIFSLILCFGLAQISGLKASALWTPPQTPTCNAVYLVNADTGTVMYQKNQDEKIYPASTTKMMTAILVYEKFKNNLNTKVTVERNDITPLEGKFGSLVPLVPGEQLTVEQLLYCMLIKSGDDSADTLARVTAGSIDSFADMMNAKAKEIGAVNTHYVNPHGLQDPEQYTTAYDTCYDL
jgi:D-alanyl-D-alanine carboxypeptidase (penicillin-binding protein 5/6)